ncbi:hypothetical protein MKY34_19555 [Sporosarcina sp. FSL K6-1522]|uniref:hypothetical protein n=1 Tax=Sporosarcina sp. FSL K6-1522 TaxID=2921554 RepID=UPI00315A92E4
MNKNERQEEEFFIVFEDLIKSFSENRKVVSVERKGFSKGFMEDFDSGTQIEPLQSDEVAASSEGNHSNSRKLDRQFKQFMEALEETTFMHYIIPYDKITKCVFENTPVEDLDEFTKDLHSRGNSYFSTKEEIEEKPIPTAGPREGGMDSERMYYKILRHIDLALVQKYTLMSMQMKEIEVLRREQQQLINRYDQLKHEAETQNRNMLTQFITILGIFAAIMMGAFGAIQGFASLFANAYLLSIGEILIISSIGASSVILILFFLLNGIAKLTGRSLWSTKKTDGSLFEKHPSLIIIHGILISISLVGATLELSNVHLQYALQGYWWLVPGLWTIYFFTAIHKKNFLFIVDWLMEKWHLFKRYLRFLGLKIKRKRKRSERRRIKNKQSKQSS